MNILVKVEVGDDSVEFVVPNTRLRTVMSLLRGAQRSPEAAIMALVLVGKAGVRYGDYDAFDDCMIEWDSSGYRAWIVLNRHAYKVDGRGRVDSTYRQVGESNYWGKWERDDHAAHAVYTAGRG
jgi:hypothetical protein